MDVFTEFWRGKTIENQEVEPYTPAGSPWGNRPPAPLSIIEYHVAVHYSPSEFQQRERGQLHLGEW